MYFHWVSRYAWIAHNTRRRQVRALMLRNKTTESSIFKFFLLVSMTSNYSQRTFIHHRPDVYFFFWSCHRTNDGSESFRQVLSIEPAELRFAGINDTEIVQLNHLISVQINMMTTDTLNMRQRTRRLAQIFEYENWRSERLSELSGRHCHRILSSHYGSDRENVSPDMKNEERKLE